MKRLLFCLGLIFLMVISGCQNTNNTELTNGNSTTGVPATEESTTEALTTETNVMVKIIVGENFFQSTKLIGEEVEVPEYEVPEGQVLVGWFISDETCENFGRAWHFDEDKVIEDTVICPMFVDEEWQLDQVIIDLEEDEMIAQIQGGIYHSALLTSKGEVYTWGINVYGQLGTNTRVNDPLIVHITDGFELNDDEVIVDISVGVAHTLALSSEHRLFGFGANNYGQITDVQIEVSFEPRDITDHFNLEEDEEIIMVEAGYYHNIAVTNKHRVFAWGYNADGQLGDGSTENRFMPVDITNHFHFNQGEVVEKIGLGSNFSVLITNEGSVYTWGNNEYGQLGNDTIESSFYPINITEFFNLDDEEMIVDIGTGAFHSLAFTDQGKVYAWGSNTVSQLATVTSIDYIALPIDITDRFGLDSQDIVNEIIVGGAFNGVLTQYNKLLVWGVNHHGQLGTFDHEEKLIPFDIINHFYLKDDQEITYIEFSGTYSFVVIDGKTIYAFGSNIYGELGVGDRVV